MFTHEDSIKVIRGALGALCSNKKHAAQHMLIKYLKDIKDEKYEEYRLWLDENLEAEKNGN